MKKVLIKEFVSHGLFLGLVSENFDYVRLYSVGSHYEVEYRYTSMDSSRVYKFNDVDHAMYRFSRTVLFLLS